jgi:hypothetical protein
VTCACDGREPSAHKSSCPEGIAYQQRMAALDKMVREKWTTWETSGEVFDDLPIESSNPRHKIRDNRLCCYNCDTSKGVKKTYDPALYRTKRQETFIFVCEPCYRARSSGGETK